MQNIQSTTGTKEPELLSPEQLAAHLGIGRTFAYQLIREKRIPSLKIGRLRRVRRADVDRYIETCLESR